MLTLLTWGVRGVWGTMRAGPQAEVRQPVVVKGAVLNPVRP